MFRSIKRPRPRKTTAVALGLFFLLACSWQIYAMILNSAYVLPDVIAVLREGWILTTKGFYQSGQAYTTVDLLFLTMRRVLTGIVPGVVLGYVAAVFVSQYPILRTFALIVSALLYSVSALAIFAILQLWLGTGEAVKYAVAAWIGFGVSYSLIYRATETIFVQTYEEPLWERMHLLGVRPCEFFLRHAWPLLGHRTIVSAQLAALLAWKLAILTDTVGENPRGVGYIVMYGPQLEGGTALMFFGALLGVVGTGLTWILFEYLGRLLLPKS